MLNSDDLHPAPVPTPVPRIAVPASLGIRAWALALAAALAAGVIAWAIGEAAIVPEVGYTAKKDNIDVRPAAAGIRNGVISFVALGAAIGLGLGLTGGLIRRSAGRAFAAGALGLLIGGGAGGALSWLILPVYYRHVQDVDMSQSLMVHGGIWVAVGAAAGLAFGIGLGGWGSLLRGLIGGAGAALLATVIYEFAGGILFPLAFTDRPISLTWQSRLAARLLVTVLIAVGVIIAAESTGQKKAAGEARA